MPSVLSLIILPVIDLINTKIILPPSSAGSGKRLIMARFRLTSKQRQWRTEPTSVEKGGDEVWIGEKFQSNPEIAGSPRNSFRASPVLV